MSNRIDFLSGLADINAIKLYAINILAFILDYSNADKFLRMLGLIAAFVYTVIKCIVEVKKMYKKDDQEIKK